MESTKMTSENDQNTVFDQSTDGAAEAQLIRREIAHDRLFGDGECHTTSIPSHI